MSSSQKLLLARNIESIEVEELLVFPGLEELFALLCILDIYKEGKYDVLIVDCAPSGETFSLLKFPEMLGHFITRVLPMKRKMVTKAGPAVEKLTKIPMPEDSVFTAIEELMERLKEMQELMQNKEVFSIRLVTTPEKIVIRETKRNFTVLSMFEYNVDAVLVNKIYPKDATKGYFRAWESLQEEGLTELREGFHDIPMFYKELDRRELKSIPLLKKCADMYRDVNPEDILRRGSVFQLEREGDCYNLEIRMPFAEKEELSLWQQGEDIVIANKNERRVYTLPDKVKRKEIRSAGFEEGMLKIEFS